MAELQKLMTRKEASEYLLAAKKDKGLTFEEIGKGVGKDKVWVAAAIMRPDNGPFTRRKAQ
jgi:cyanate lyase